MFTLAKLLDVAQSRIKQNQSLISATDTQLAFFVVWQISMKQLNPRGSLQAFSTPSILSFPIDILATGVKHTYRFTKIPQYPKGGGGRGERVTKLLVPRFEI